MWVLSRDNGVKLMVVLIGNYDREIHVWVMSQDNGVKLMVVLIGR